jgi:SAM-dependent methyltransferase
MRHVPFTRSLPLRLLARRRAMSADWDERARLNAFFYICTEAATVEEFAASGVRDLDEKVLERIALPPRAVAVEIGSGIGRLARPLAARVAKVYACDVSAEMIARGREYCRDTGNIEWVHSHGDLRGVPDGCADFVFSHIVFQHVPRKKFIRAYVAEAFRVLKPGGSFRANVDGRWRQWFRRIAADSWSGVVYSAREWRRELERAGLRVASIEGAGTQYLWATATKPESV